MEKQELNLLNKQLQDFLMRCKHKQEPINGVSKTTVDAYHLQITIQQIYELNVIEGDLKNVAEEFVEFTKSKLKMQKPKLYSGRRVDPEYIYEIEPLTEDETIGVLMIKKDLRLEKLKPANKVSDEMNY